MQAGKAPLQKRVRKSLFHELEIVVAWPEAIAMGNEERFAIAFDYLLLSVKDNTQLLWQVIIHPDIVVARKKMNGNPTVNNLRYGAKEPGKPTGYNFSVFVPKVENIAHQENFRSIRFYGI